MTGRQGRLLFIGAVAAFWSAVGFLVTTCVGSCAR